MLHFMLFQLIIISWFSNYVERCDFDHMDGITAWCAFVCFSTLCLNRIEIHILSYCIIPHNLDDTPQNMFRSVRTSDHHNQNSLNFSGNHYKNTFEYLRPSLQDLFWILRLRLQQLFWISSNHYKYSFEFSGNHYKSSKF